MIQLSVEHLIERIGRSFKNLTLNPGELAAWCYEAMEEYAMCLQLKEERGVIIPVVEGRAQLPINIYRLLSVNSSCGPCNETCYVTSSRCLNFPLYTNGTAELHMLVFPSDERGYPLIDDTFMQVCYWYCLKYLLLEDFISGNLPGNRYEKIEQQLELANNRSRSSMRNMTDANLEKYGRILRSSVIAQRFKLR